MGRMDAIRNRLINQSIKQLMLAQIEITFIESVFGGGNRTSDFSISSRERLQLRNSTTRTLFYKCHSFLMKGCNYNSYPEAKFA